MTTLLMPDSLIDLSPRATKSLPCTNYSSLKIRDCLPLPSLNSDAVDFSALLYLHPLKHIHRSVLIASPRFVLFLVLNLFLHFTRLSQTPSNNMAPSGSSRDSVLHFAVKGHDCNSASS